MSWSKNDKTLNWKATFPNGEALVKHMREVRPLIDALDAGPAKLERIEVHGPPAEVLKLQGQESAKALQIQYYETADTSKQIDCSAAEGEKKTIGDSTSSSSSASDPASASSSAGAPASSSAGAAASAPLSEGTPVSTSSSASAPESLSAGAAGGKAPVAGGQPPRSS